MQIASQKYDPFYFNCSRKHGYKSELKKLKDIRKDRIVEFTKYFSSFEVLEFNHNKINDVLNYPLNLLCQKNLMNHRLSRSLIKT